MARQTGQSLRHSSGDTLEVQLGAERYLAKTVTLAPDGNAKVSLTVLKSFDKATVFLNELNRILIGWDWLASWPGAGSSS